MSRKIQKNKKAIKAVTAPDNSEIILDRRLLLGVAGCFFLSGFAALIYQMVWLRQFSIVFGTSELAVATVLAAYMGGLALGAVIVDRYIAVLARPVWVYGLLEAGIAVSALCVPLLLAAASSTYAFILGDHPNPPDSSGIGQTLFYLIVSFLVLAIPTGLMGATLPLLTRYAVRSNSQIGPRVALLYAVNAFGAVFGTVAAAFLFLPQLGLMNTVWVGVFVNILVFLIAVLLSRQLPLLESFSKVVDKRRLAVSFVTSVVKPWLDTSRTFAERVEITLRRQSAWLLPIMLLSGANAFLYEVLWTRMLNHVLGGSVYAFATMLATFLAGISLGSAIGGRYTRNREQAVGAFAVSQIAIAVASMLIYLFLDRLVPEHRALQSNILFAAAVLLPATLFIGATFPLAVRILARDETEVSSVAARVYAWNTVGSIVGAVGAGFFLIPAVGFEGAIKCAVIINLALAAGTLSLVSVRPFAYAAVLVIALVLTFVIYDPVRPTILVNSAGFKGAEMDNMAEEYFAVGRSSTVQLVDYGGGFNLRTNGLPEASIISRGAPPFKHLQKWLTALPVVARPDATSMLVVGFGGGVALEGVPPSIKSVDVIELEPEVINANQVIATRRAIDPLADPRVNVIINDARNALRLTDKRYDIIVSQPSHPWTAGASHLFTAEFIKIAHDHLTDNGVYLQWMNVNFVDAGLLRSLVATMLVVFDNVKLYHAEGGVLLFLGADTPIDMERQLVRTGRPLSDYPAHYASLGLNSVEDIIVTLALDETGARNFARGEKATTDNFNRMATDSRYLGDGLTVSQTINLLAPYDPLLNLESWVHREMGVSLNFTYIGSRLINDRLGVRANKLANMLADRSTALLIHAMGMKYQGKNEEALGYINAAIAENPENMQAKFALVQNQMEPLLRRQADENVLNIAANMNGIAAAVMGGWQYAATKNWRSLAGLDKILSRSRPTDIWYGDAIQLRAEWRTKVSVAQSSTRFARDALSMLDRAILLRKDLDLYVLRAGAGILIEDPAVFVETSWHIRTFIQALLDRAKRGEYKFSPELRKIMIGRLKGILRQMKSKFVEPVGERAITIGRDIEATLVEFEAYRP